MKAIMAVDDHDLEERIKKQNNVEIILKNLQYREAILEFLEENKNVNLIYISEKIPGGISIEKLIKKIKIINKKINIIFILEKQDENKKKKLNNIGIKKIYIKDEFKKNLRKGVMNKLKNEINLDIKDEERIKNKKIITIAGKTKTGKTTITNLISKYLMENNKRIFVFYLNRKNQRKYFRGLERDYDERKKLEKEVCEIFFSKSKKYDYILIDIGNNCNAKIKKLIIDNSDENFIVIDQNMLGIKGIKDIINTEKKNLHIIYNKYRYGGISEEIIINFFDKAPKIYKIYYKKNYKDLGKDNCKIENIKIDKKSRNEIRKIFYKI